MTGPSWLELDRGAFNLEAPDAGLFDPAPAMVAADDSHGTGDLLELLDDRFSETHRGERHSR